MNAFLRAGLLLLSLFFVQKPAGAQGSWDPVSLPTHQFLRSIQFVDSLYGWIAGDSGTILHTVDGGRNWQLQATHHQYDVSSVFFLDRLNGWASALNYTETPYGTILMRTRDGGDTWEQTAYPDENIFITCMLFLDSLNGWMGGRPHALVRTADGGNTWAQAEVDTSILAFFPVLTIKFWDQKYGYASGGMFDIAGVIWRTSDGGQKWYAIDAVEAPADEVHGLHLFDSTHVIGAGGDPDFGYGVGMIRTDNGGINWTYDELEIQGNAYDIDFRDEREVWAPLGPRRKLMYSMDAANTWTQVLTPDSMAIYKMTFADSLHGFAIGAGGALLRYRPREIPSVPPKFKDQIAGITLLQNAPNPFSESTAIRIIIEPEAFKNTGPDRTGTLVMQVIFYDLIGNIRDSRTVHADTPGEYQVIFTPSSAAPGIYYYRIQIPDSNGAGSFTKPLKMAIR